MNALVDVVVVTHQSRRFVDVCLDSLRGSGVRTRVLVVDSGSTDGGPAAIRDRFPEVEVHELGENVGFARGVNHGLALTDAPFVLLLNPDATLEPDALRRMVDRLNADESLGAVGPRLQDRRGELQPTAQRFPSLGGELARTWSRLAAPLRLQRDDERVEEADPIDWLSGACLLMRRAALEEVGPLDPGFFLYFEETDWFRRAGEAGWSCALCAEASVVHAGGGCAEQASGGRSRRLDVHFRASRSRYFRKHHGRLVAGAVETLHGLRSLRERLRGAEASA